MDTLLRWYAKWKGRRKAAQIIVFDGGAEVEKTRAFLKGGITGVVGATILFALTGPETVDPTLVEEVRRRDRLLEDANAKVHQVVALNELCLGTARSMEQTLQEYQEVVASYQQYLGR